MSILTASNPLILALVLSLYHVSKESYRILKLKKILICSMVGYFTLPFLWQPAPTGSSGVHQPVGAPAQNAGSVAKGL